MAPLHASTHIHDGTSVICARNLGQKLTRDQGLGDLYELQNALVLPARLPSDFPQKIVQCVVLVTVTCISLASPSVSHVLEESSSRTSPPGNSAYLPLAGQPLDARLPLSLLESVRSVDTPAAELDAELVHELRNKRFGLSDTVYMQIKRYQDAVTRKQRVAYDEVLALSRLIGRRPDADLIFREAGRRIARAAVATIPATTRRMSTTLPALLGRPIALRQLRQLCKRFLDGRLVRHGSTLVLEIIAPVSADAATRGAGCGFYEAAMRESLLVLADADGAVEHVACRSRGDARCQWRAEWRRR